jgi:hypothetical protein
LRGATSGDPGRELADAIGPKRRAANRVRAVGDPETEITNTNLVNADSGHRREAPAFPCLLRIVTMAALATGNLDRTTTLHQHQTNVEPGQLTSTVLLNVVEACLHRSTSEWIFLRELRVGTGFHGNAAQRLDAFALNCLPHTSMRRVCYEVKTSRADFLCEIKQPLKRRIALRYSNEFYFVTPAGLLRTSELPIECGLVEIGTFTRDERLVAHGQSSALVHFEPNHGMYCRVTVPAPWRETPGPTWQFVAGMLRNQQKVLQGRPSKAPNQQRLPFSD